MSSENPFVAYAYQAAQRAGIDPEIFVRQINQESGFNPRAGSGAGAQGIAQIMPQYHNVDPWDPYASLDYAANLMASHLRNYGGDYRMALAAYNTGPGNLATYGLDFVLSDAWAGGETKNYVGNILGGSGMPSPSPFLGGGPDIPMLPATNTSPEGPQETPDVPRGGFDWGIIPQWLGERFSPERRTAFGQFMGNGMFGGSATTAAAASPTGDGQPASNEGGEVADPRAHPSHPDHWEYAYNLISQAKGGIVPFTDKATYDQWRLTMGGDKEERELDMAMKRLQMAKMMSDIQRGSQGQLNEDAWRNAQLRLQYDQLKEAAAERLAKMRQGPENWLAYWDTSRGGDGAIGAAQNDVNSALPAWTNAPPPFVSAPPYPGTPGVNTTLNIPGLFPPPPTGQKVNTTIPPVAPPASPPMFDTRVIRREATGRPT